MQWHSYKTKQPQTKMFVAAQSFAVQVSDTTMLLFDSQLVSKIVFKVSSFTT
jgi:hypothetical protein